MENLYLIKCNEYFKIGIANDLGSRLAQLQTGNPYALVVRACFQFPNAGIVEKAIHQKFSGVRKLGEWFTLGENDVDDFLALCRLLGGMEVSDGGALVDQDRIEEAEEIQEAALDGVGRWDYQSMFADGWSMVTSDSRKRYWIWRKRQNGADQTIYGGPISDLPFPDLGEMRRVFRDGKLYQPYMKELGE